MQQTVEKTDALPPPIVVGCAEHNLDELLSKEWLITNGIGAYASSTVIGCNTRRYHGLLVAATSPPVGRINALATVMEWVGVGSETYPLGTGEFPGAVSPRGVDHLVEFRNDPAPTFVYRLGEAELTKRIILPERKNAVAIQYLLRGGAGVLHLRPFAALRDFHHLRRAADPHQLTFQSTDAGLIVQDLSASDRFTKNLYLATQDARFRPDREWWYRFHYRLDLERGQEHLEDLYSPGVFTFELTDGRAVQLNASMDEPVSVGFDTTTRRRRTAMADLAGGVGDDADETTRRLAIATGPFAVRRSFVAASPTAPSATILAGYHWFADWGRDAFIALPGLLLNTRRFNLAKGVFATFAEHLSDGMIPNRFDDYSNTPHYNSIDASLWFIVAAERYLAAGGDKTFWRDLLMPTAETILSAYHAGTLFDIHADADGLLTGGSETTQLTWMDAKLADEVVTPRHGKAVEVNALWYAAHAIMGERCKHLDDAAAHRHSEQAELIAPAFVKAFWNAEADCLYDCIRDDEADASIRPNQIFAVSLPHSPLSTDRQRSVLRVVTERLLTPYGLRTLDPRDPRYRGRYGGSWESRDRAYHQGTVWAWLLGAYVEAYLKLEGGEPSGVERARGLLAAFDEHLMQGGLGQISEIFDGDPPHAPRGCIAQAWSVAEILRAKQLVAEYAARLGQ